MKMSNLSGNRVGEDKLSKMVRLLAKYELELGMVEGHVYINVDSCGQGQLFAAYHLMYEFQTTQDLVAFLEANQLDRTRLVRDSLEAR